MRIHNETVLMAKGEEKSDSSADPVIRRGLWENQWNDYRRKEMESLTAIYSSSLLVVRPLEAPQDPSLSIPVEDVRLRKVLL